MADNLVIPGIGTVRTKEQTNLSHIQVVCLFGPNGEIIPVSAANGLAVDVTRVTGNVAVTGAFLTDAQLRATPVPVVESVPSTANYFVVAAAAAQASVQLRPLTATRKGLLIFNDADTALHIFFGTPASTTNRSYPPIPAQGYFEMPNRLYAGLISGYWDLTGGGANPTGNARITEIVT